MQLAAALTAPAMLSSALLTGVVVANYRGAVSDPEAAPQPAQPVAEVPPVPPKRVAQQSGTAPVRQERPMPSRADIAECNRLREERR
jgi:hypothetical protein